MSDRYGQHLSKEDIETLVAPHPDTVNLVDAWLAAHDVPASDIQRLNGGAWLSVPITVGQASRMLNATYSIYQHEDTSEYIVRTTSYSLPKVLHSHVGVVTPTTYFSTLRSMRSTSFLQPHIKPLDNDIETAPKLVGPASLATVPSSCASTITPACLRALYNTTTYVPQATDVNKLGVAGYLEEFANDADLQVFLLRESSPQYWLICLSDILQEIQNRCHRHNLSTRASQRGW
jgi:tripeptidyl-peptidase I